MKRILPYLIALVALSAEAQDPHFSQWFRAPASLNPAQTGLFEGHYRFFGNYRRQWAAISEPFVTAGIGAEARRPLSNIPLSAGVSIYNDQAGTGALGTLHFQASFSYQYALGKDSTTFINLGVQGGWNRKQIDFNKLDFDQQYQGGTFDPSNPINETFARSNTSYTDLHTGLILSHKFSAHKKLRAGIAVHNLLQPDQSFTGETDNIDRRYSLHGSFQFPVHYQWDLIPRMLFMNQGPHREFVIGGDAKYTLDSRSFAYTALYLGAYSRVVDAFIFHAALDYKEWQVGVSYDVNYSTLNVASNGRGGFELAVIYTIRNLAPKRIYFKQCPDFI